MGLKSSSWIWRASSMVIDHSLPCLLSTVLWQLKWFKAGNIALPAITAFHNRSLFIHATSTNMFIFLRYERDMSFCDFVRMSFSHKNSYINGIWQIWICKLMSQFGILSSQLTKIIACKDISPKNSYLNLRKLFWIVISDSMWQHIKHFVPFAEFTSWNFGIF